MTQSFTAGANQSLRSIRSAAVQVLRSRRFNIYWPVQITHAKYGVTHGAVVNISTSGLLFRALARFPMGENVEVEIQLPDKTKVRAVGQIVREAHNIGYGFFFGVRFATF